MECQERFVVCAANLFLRAESENVKFTKYVNWESMSEKYRRKMSKFVDDKTGKVWYDGFRYFTGNSSSLFIR